jgi:hypothetical protein
MALDAEHGPLSEPTLEEMMEVLFIYTKVMHDKQRASECYEAIEELYPGADIESLLLKLVGRGLERE